MLEVMLQTDGFVEVKTKNHNKAKGVILNITGTSKDVLHSIGSDIFGTLDVCPGRQHKVSTFVPFGFYSGRCMELCGVGHSHMPISF